MPKILLIANSNAVGSFKVQCTGATPRAHGDNRGWYKITLNGLGGVLVAPLLRQYFHLNPVPYVVLSMDKTP
jgi:hypothetical protein